MTDQPLTFKPTLRPGADQFLWNEMWTTDTAWQGALKYVRLDAKLIIDVGCYTGLTTMCYAGGFPDSKVIGIEMNPESASIAVINTRQFKHRVNIINAAVGTPRMTKAFFKPQFGPQDSIIFNEPGREQIDLQVFDLDSLIPSKQIINFMKIDIEGAEREILPIGGSWAERTEVIQVEVHGYGYDYPQAIKDIKNLGFKIAEGPHLIGVK